MFVYNTDYAALCETWKEFGNIIFIFTKAKSANCMEIKQKKYTFLDAKCLFGKCLSKVFFFFPAWKIWHVIMPVIRIKQLFYCNLWFCDFYVQTDFKLWLPPISWFHLELKL